VSVIVISVMYQVWLGSRFQELRIMESAASL
jgi:hypothetical protein